MSNLVHTFTVISDSVQDLITTHIRCNSNVASKQSLAHSDGPDVQLVHGNHTREPGPMAFFFLFFFNFVINQSGNDAQEDLARFGYNIKIIYIFLFLFLFLFFLARYLNHV